MKKIKQIGGGDWKFIVPVILIFVSLVAGGWFAWTKLSASNELSKEKIKERVLAYIEETLPETPASVNSVKKLNKQSIFELELDVGGQEFTSYVTLDGRFLFPSGVDLNEFVTQTAESEGEEEGEEDGALSELPQSETPDVKLFTMSYCPYGLQVEKAMLPVWDLLGDKMDMGIYFVDYAMHEKKEIDENLRQYCIQKEQSDKIASYLGCFVQAGESGPCLALAEVDTGQLDSCTESADQEFQVTENYENKEKWLNDRYPRFQVHSELNEQFDISGSPTLVVNGVRVVSSKGQCPDEASCFVNPEFNRTPESIKNVLCSAFEEAPDECEEELSDEAPAPSFGGENASGSSSGGGCEG